MFGDTALLDNHKHSHDYNFACVVHAACKITLYYPNELLAPPCCVTHSTMTKAYQEAIKDILGKAL